MAAQSKNPANTTHPKTKKVIVKAGELVTEEELEDLTKADLPEATINKPPSAGLWSGQTDEGELKITYEQLDQAVLEITSDRDKKSSPEIRSRVEELIKNSEHKRIPIPVFKNQ